MSAEPIVEDDRFGVPEPSADELAARAAGPMPMGEVLFVIHDIDSDALTAAGRADYLRALERISRWSEASKHSAIAAMVEGCDGLADAIDPDGKQWVREEIACVLDVSPDHARTLIAESVPLASQFRTTHRLLSDGQITGGHARALVNATQFLEPAIAAKVEKRVLKRAPRQSVANFRRSLARAVASLDPRSAEQRHEQAREQRRVWKSPQNDGMCDMGISLSAEDAETVWTALDAHAQHTRSMNPSDERTLDQLRADAVVQLSTAYLCGKPVEHGVPLWKGRKPTVNITVGLETLLGLNDEPAELDHHGPIGAELARRIASDPSGTWRRLITDKPGKLLDYQQTQYKPPPPLRDHTVRRDRRCRFPNCNRPAINCDIDHLIDWQHGGPTRARNLECLCARHHALKHESDWQLIGDPEGTLTWISPTGHRYTSDPPVQPGTVVRGDRSEQAAGDSQEFGDR